MESHPMDCNIEAAVNERATRIIDEVIVTVRPISLRTGIRMFLHDVIVRSIYEGMALECERDIEILCNSQKAQQIPVTLPQVDEVQRITLDLVGTNGTAAAVDSQQRDTPQ